MSLERKELRRYSVWEQLEMQAQDIYFERDEDPSPPAVLVLCVSQMAAAAVQRELLNLCLKQDAITDIGKYMHLDFCHKNRTGIERHLWTVSLFMLTKL